MILIDFSQIVMSSIHSDIWNLRKEDFNEDFFRHMVLNILRSYRVKHHKEFGELVLCCDGRGYWRKKEFEHYKAGRAAGREASKIDFDEVFHWMDNIKSDLREYFPYKVVEVHGAEADDVIGFLAAKFAAHEPILIVSSDKDFQQLQKYKSVKQYSPLQKKWIRCENPSEYLKEHIIRGDGGDGVPNVFSDTDTIVTPGKRQKPVSSKNMPRWIGLTPEQFCKETGVSLERYTLNQRMVDLSFTPLEIREEIARQFDEYTPAPRMKILTYLTKNRMRHLASYATDF